MAKGRQKLESTLTYKDYCTARRVVAYIHEDIKAIVREDQRQHVLKESEIITKAISEYYDRRPELVEKLKSTMGKNYF